MKTTTIILGLVLMISLTFAFDNANLSLAAHSNLKLNIAIMIDTGENGFDVQGEIQYTRLRGSSHGHIDLVATNASGDEFIVGSSGKISTRRGVMGYKRRNFKIHVMSDVIDDQQLTLRFHDHMKDMHYCHC